MLAYLSGEPVRTGDEIRYHGVPGRVEFVVTERTGDKDRDWYVEQFPGGGAMIWAEGFGNVFIGVDALDEQLEFVGRTRAAR